MSNLENKPKVGIGIMILKDNKVLLGKRKGSHGAGEYAFPGGHLEYMESFENCAKREAMEERGIEIDNIRFQFVSNITEYRPKHYIHIGLLADLLKGEPKVMEPERCESWGWFGLEDLPSPLFKVCALSIESYKKNKIYFDIPETEK
jgi:8-oxo-dGTP diphosphatase